MASLSPKVTTANQGRAHPPIPLPWSSPGHVPCLPVPGSPPSTEPLAWGQEHRGLEIVGPLVSSLSSLGGQCPSFPQPPACSRPISHVSE